MMRSVGYSTHIAPQYQNTWEDAKGAMIYFNDRFEWIL